MRVRGFDFDVRTEGDPAGEVVVLLHGFPAHAGSWDRLTPGLVEAGYRVVRPDQRGYSPGARPAGRSAYTAAELAADVLAILDELGLDRVHLVGHDWGGGVAWGLASAAPARLRTLTAVSTPHPRALLRAMLTGDQARRSWYIGGFQLPLVPERLLLSGNGKPLRTMLRRSGLPPAVADDYADRMAAPGALTAALNWYRALPLDRPDIGRITVPTLYVWGDADFALGPAAAAGTARWVTGPYTFVQLDGAGHWIPEVEPERLLAPLLHHLRR
ncbi:MAG TPA: alpha/beta fold hydrolase [Mycobacteriales bacterium]